LSTLESGRHWLGQALGGFEQNELRSYLDYLRPNIAGNASAKGELGFQLSIVIDRKGRLAIRCD
jgi:hypothetical protein